MGTSTKTAGYWLFPEIGGYVAIAQTVLATYCCLVLLPDFPG
jgi:hypothetical protein